MVLIAVHMSHDQTQQAIQMVQYTRFRRRIFHHLGNEVSFTGSLVYGVCVFLRNRLGQRCIGQLWFEVYRVLAVLMACHRACRPWFHYGPLTVPDRHVIELLHTCLADGCILLTHLNWRSHGRRLSRLGFFGWGTVAICLMVVSRHTPVCLARTLFTV